MKLLKLSLIVLILNSCTTAPPKSPNDICEIFDEKRSWYKASIRTYERWDIEPSITMAFIKQESSFQQGAKPERERIFFGLIPWKRESSAYGYAQVIDGTWDLYKQEAGRTFASRTNFSDSVDFIGWYNNRNSKNLRISKKNARSLYLAYHEGPEGFKKGSYRSKPWLLGVADKVQRSANNYRVQFTECKDELKNPFYFLFN